MFFLDFLFNQIFPEKCSSCIKNNLKLGKPLCEICLTKLALIDFENRCLKCGDILSSKFCSCSQRYFFFNRSVYAWLYNRQGRKLLKQVKFDKRSSAIRYIKKNIPNKIWEMLDKLKGSAIFVLPSSHIFIKKVASFLASKSSLPLYDIFYKKNKKIQSKMMHEQERFIQIEKNLAINVDKLQKIIEKNYLHFILVDDIWTSGATMNLAAKLLNDNGVSTDKIFVFGLFRREKICNPH